LDFVFLSPSLNGGFSWFKNCIFMPGTSGSHL
jgi:hypothetical protein